LATHRHVKSGKFYRFLRWAVLEKTRQEVAVYEDPHGMTWVRPADEFLQNERFETINDDWLG
jgi:hypothetical protein